MKKLLAEGKATLMATGECQRSLGETSPVTSQTRSLSEFTRPRWNATSNLRNGADLGTKEDLFDNPSAPKPSRLVASQMARISMDCGFSWLKRFRTRKLLEAIAQSPHRSATLIRWEPTVRGPISRPIQLTGAGEVVRVEPKVRRLL